MTRYALYYTPPPDSPLGRLGARWFADPAVEDLTGQPRVYGFHATLKAPFRLAEGRSEAELSHALETFCADRSPAEVGPLRLADLGGFLALVPERQGPAIERLAADCVTAFDEFRAPLREAELERRRTAGLSRHQEAFLARWGYPYVFDEFRFHMTLTRRLGAAEKDSVAATLEPLVAPAVADPLTVEAVSLSMQPEEGDWFEVRERVALAGSGS